MKAAFERAEHSDGNEQDLVAALRRGEAFVPELSLVAQRTAGIVGHIRVDQRLCGRPGCACSGAAVCTAGKPSGRALAARSWRQAARPQRPWAMTISPCWGVRLTIPRAGYIPAEQLGIQAPFEVPPENFMALRLREDAAPVNGVLQYAAEFGL